MCFIESTDKLAKDCIKHRTVEANNLDSQTGERPIPSLEFKDSPMQDILKNVPSLYPEDKFFSHVVKNPEHYNKFEVCKGILWTQNHKGEHVICIPKGTAGGKTLRGSLLDACHRTLGHLGPHKTLAYVRHWFWWPWETIGMDFAGPYPEIKGFNYILLIICHMMGMVHVIPT